MSRDKGGYEVRRVKTFRGREGYGFNAELCRDGKPVAYVIDDAGGGCFHWEWYDRDKPTVTAIVERFGGEKFEISALPEEAKLMAHVAKLPKEPWEYDTELHAVTDEIFVGGLVDDFANDARMKRLCKTKVLFRLAGDKEGEYRVVKAAYDARAKEWMAGKYGDKVVEVLNDKYAAEG